MATLLLLDGVWIRWYALGEYRKQIQEVQKEELSPKRGWKVASALAYALMAVGMGVLVRPWEGTPSRAAGSGMVLGGVVYGVYDCTNFVILKEWGSSFAVVDAAWGAVLFAASALVGNLVS